MEVLVMEPLNEIKEYQETVCNQIRWKRAHVLISEEIENHIIDQRDAYISDGDVETTATNKAIIQMGDPVTVGTQLDRTHRPKAQWSMIFLTMLLLLIGLLIRMFIINDSDYPWNLPKQLFSTILGLGVMLVVYYADFSLIGKYPKTIYFIVLMASIIILFTSSEVNGKPYFHAGFLSFSYTYLTLFFPLTYVAIIYVTRGKGYIGIIQSGIAFLPLACLARVASAFSGFLLLTISGLVLISIAIHKNWFRINKKIGYGIVFIPTAICFLFTLLTMREYSYEHLKLASGNGYMGQLTKELLKNARLFGRGTMPEQYSMYTFPSPNIDADYLLTYLIFNVGWIALYIIIAILIIFIIKGFMMCMKQKSILGLLVSLAVMMTFSYETIGYILFNLGIQLIAPISLPLISYGNIATIINLALIGVMLSVFRSGDIVSDEKVRIYSNGRFITWNDGRLIIDFNK
jgi:cell division protein FtsW (lipid II flippase)